MCAACVLNLLIRITQRFSLHKIPFVLTHPRLFIFSNVVHNQNLDCQDKIALEKFKPLNMPEKLKLIFSSVLLRQRIRERKKGGRNFDFQLEFNFLRKVEGINNEWIRRVERSLCSSWENWRRARDFRIEIWTELLSTNQPSSI